MSKGVNLRWFKPIKRFIQDLYINVDTYSNTNYYFLYLGSAFTLDLSVFEKHLHHQEDQRFSRVSSSKIPRYFKRTTETRLFIRPRERTDERGTRQLSDN